MAEGLFGPESIFHRSASEVVPFLISVSIMVFIGFALLEPFLAWLQHGGAEEHAEPTRRQTFFRRLIGFAIVVFLTLLLTIFEDLHRETLVHKNLIAGWLVAMAVAWSVTYFWVLGAQHGRMRATIYGTLASLGIGVITTGLILMMIVLGNLPQLINNEQALRGFLANLPATLWLLIVSNIGGWVLSGLLGGLAIDFGRGLPVCARLFVALVIAGVAITVSNWPIADDNTSLFRDLIRSSGWGLALLLYPAAHRGLKPRHNTPPWYMSAVAVALGLAALVAITTVSWGTAWLQRERFYDAIISFGRHDGPIAEVLPLHDDEVATFAHTRPGETPETTDLTVRVWRIDDSNGEKIVRERRRMLAYNMPASATQPTTAPAQMALLDLHAPHDEHEQLWTLSLDGHVTVWDRDRAFPLQRAKVILPPRAGASAQTFYGKMLLATPPRIVTGCFDHEGSLMFIADQFGRVHEYELKGKELPAAGELTSSATHVSGLLSITTLALSHDAKHIAVGGPQGGLTVIDRAKREFHVLSETDSSKTRFNHLAWSEDHDLIAGALENGNVMLWQVSTGKIKQELNGHEAPATAVAFTPDGRHVASTSLNPERAFALWDLKTGEAVFGGRQVGGATALTIYANGTRAATGSSTGVVTLWRIPPF